MLKLSIPKINIMYVYVNISITRICLRKPDWTRLVGPTLKLFEEKKIQSGTQFLKKKKKKIIPQYQRYSFRIFCDKIGAHNKPFLKIFWFVVILLILLDWSFDELNKKKVIRLAQFLKMIFESFEYAVLDTSFRHVSLTCAQGKNLIMKKKKKIYLFYQLQGRFQQQVLLKG